MRLLRIAVTVLVALPLWLAVGWPHPWWITLGIAAAAVGAGYGVEGLKRWALDPLPSTASAQAPADRTDPLALFLKKALAAEQRGEWDTAQALFEHVLQRTTDPEGRALAQRRLQEIAAKRAPLT